MITKETIYRYAVSSLVTFAAGFALAVVPMIDGLTLESVQNGALIGVFFAGCRLGVKMVLEAGILLYKTYTEKV